MNKLNIGDKVYLVNEEWEVRVVDEEANDSVWYSIKNPNHELWITQDGRMSKDSAPIFSLTPYRVEGLVLLNTERFEKGQLVFVKDYEAELWNARFYSHFEDGDHYCFEDQKKDGEVTSWSYITSKI